jgi:hypothetical protein
MLMVKIYTLRKKKKMVANLAEAIILQKVGKDSA